MKCPECNGYGQVPSYDVTPIEENDICIMCNGSGLLDKNKFTCNTCFSKDECQYAWDLYNTDGDCLALK